MVLRMWRYLCLWLAAVMLAVPSTSAAAQRIVAVGDLHGDYEAWIDIARDAGLIDAKNRWSGGATTLVQTGDIADRGPDSLKIIRHLQKLQKEADKAGGKVIVLLGNHEAMNVTGDLRYVHPGEYAAFRDSNSEALRQAVWDSNAKLFIANYRAKNPQLNDKQVRAAWFEATPPGLLEHQRAWAPDGEIGRWVVTLPAIVKVGGNLFAHGGISAPYTAMGGLDEINRRASAALKARETAYSSVINDPLGPLWYRGLITRGSAFESEVAAAAASSGMPERPRPPVAQELDMVLTAFGAKRLIVGHTPSLGGIDISHGGKLVRIDTGISWYYKGQPSWLEINGDQVTAHKVARSR